MPKPIKAPNVDLIRDQIRANQRLISLWRLRAKNDPTDEHAPAMIKTFTFNVTWWGARLADAGASL